jgi:hypothetical protein
MRLVEANKDTLENRDLIKSVPTLGIAQRKGGTEMKSKRYLILMLVVVVGLFMASCGAGKKAAATAAVQAAEDAYNAAKPQLMKYVPDQTKGVEDAINGAKASLEKRDYEAALTAAQAVPAKVKELTAAAVAKREELKKNWQETSGDITNLLRTIRGRLTLFSIPKEVPPNLDKAKIKAARSGYEEATSMWEQAQNAFAAGNLPGATAKADTIREKAMEIMRTLGIKAPAAPTKG